MASFSVLMMSLTEVHIAVVALFTSFLGGCAFLTILAAVVASFVGFAKGCCCISSFVSTSSLV